MPNSVITQNPSARSWHILSPDTDLHVRVQNEVGSRVSQDLFPQLVNRPTAIQVLPNGKIVIYNYYQRQQKFTSDYAAVGDIGITYQNPTEENEGIGYLFGGKINTSQTRVALASWARHVVRVYDLDDPTTYLFEIGVPASGGHVADGKIGNPFDVVWLPNGNLLVSCYTYRGANGTNHGHVSEYSGDTGQLVASRLEFGGLNSNTGFVTQGGVYRPGRMHVDSVGKLWLINHGRNEIGRFNMTPNEHGYYQFEAAYYSPAGTNWGSLYGICLSSNEQTVIVGSRNDQRIYGLDIETHAAMFIIEPAKMGLGTDFRDVRLLKHQDGADYVIFSDWSRHSVCVVRCSETEQIAYTIPTPPIGMSIDNATDSLSPQLNTETGILSVQTHELDHVGDLVVLFS